MLLFTTSFYSHFPAPNARELINAVDLYNNPDNIDNSKFTWGNLCDVDRIPLKKEDFHDLYKPSMEVAFQEFGGKFGYSMSDPWMNLYKRGQHQELHDHGGYDLSSVFFRHDGIGVSKDDMGSFYFRDRNNSQLTQPIQQIVGYSAYFSPKIREGDIIFFPSHILHGVTPNKTDKTRVSMSTNFRIII